MPEGSRASGKVWLSEDRRERGVAGRRRLAGSSKERGSIFLPGSYLPQPTGVSLALGQGWDRKYEGFCFDGDLQVLRAGDHPAAPQPSGSALSVPQAPLSTSPPSRDLSEFTGLRPKTSAQRGRVRDRQ